MLDILIAGVGGQGSVLASKILAQAAADRGWQVRTAETIGMAQRGGSVTSHVRMGSSGESVEAPLIMPGSADMIIALEPAEGLRVLPYLKPDGLMVSATTPVASVMTNLAGDAYTGADQVEWLKNNVARYVAVDDAAACEAAGSRKALNIVMLASALQAAGRDFPLSVEDMREALPLCVKPRFVEMNLRAIDAVID